MSKVCRDNKKVAEINALQAEDTPSLLVELIHIFLLHAPAKIEEMRQGIFERDARKIEQTAHGFRGDAGHFGAASLLSHCALLEMRAKAASLSNLESLFVKLEAEFARVETALCHEKSQHERGDDVNTSERQQTELSYGESGRRAHPPVAVQTFLDINHLSRSLPCPQ
jgi:HPt (histidine-containing phosphotransfer) domain-containing protein